MVDQKMLTDLPNQGQFIHDPMSREIPNSNSTMGCGHIFKEGSVIHVRKRIAGESLTKRTKYGVSRQGLCVCRIPKYSKQDGPFNANPRWIAFQP